MIDRFRESMARGLILLDAAMGTRLLSLGLDLRFDDPALWNVSRPDDVLAIHRRDVAAGADALVTNTFGANRHALARFGRERQVASINRRAVALARVAAGPGRFVLGSIGPTAAADPPSYREQAACLLEAGVDALLMETHRAEQAILALEQLRHVRQVSLLVSLFAWPEPLRETVHQLESLGAAALGANCQLGMSAARHTAEALRRISSLPLIVKPAAGLPCESLETPASFADALPAFRALGPILIGGCCGTTEEHVAALRAACQPVSKIHREELLAGTAAERNGERSA